MPCRIFLHGFDSSSRGTKGRYFKENFPGMLVPDFSGSLAERMEKLYEILSNESEITMVGSSYGGLMASIFSLENKEKVKGLFLLAPAINLNEFNDYLDITSDVPVILYHGTRDNVIPIDPVFERAKKCFKTLTFCRVDDDHMLHKIFRTIDWHELLNS